MTARLFRALVLAAAFRAVFAPVDGFAGTPDVIEVQSAILEPAASGDGWVLAADFSVPLPARLAEAINHGVAAYFVVDFELVRPRWYWWDDKTAQFSQSYRLSYHALTRQYRLTARGLPQLFGTLDEAVAALSRVRGLRVLDQEQTRPGVEYQAQVRMRLDASMLPKPFQVSAIANPDWSLNSEWTRFRFAP